MSTVLHTPRLLIFVHTCDKYIESRALIVQNTWAKNRNNVYFITDQPTDKLQQSICIGKYPPIFTYHPVNVHKMFQLFLSDQFAPHYDFFMFIDDDSYLFIDKLLKYLEFFNPNDQLIIADFLNWSTHIPNFTADYASWPSGGPGMIFTKSSIYLLLKQMEITKIPFNNHDVWIHNLYLKTNKKIKRIHCPGFHQYQVPLLLSQTNIMHGSLISLHLEKHMELMEQIHNSFISDTNKELEQN